MVWRQQHLTRCVVKPIESWLSSIWRFSDKEVCYCVCVCVCIAHRRVCLCVYWGQNACLIQCMCRDLEDWLWAQHTQCVCVCAGGTTGARKRDPMLIAFRMMTLFSHLSSLHLSLFLISTGTRKKNNRQGEQTSLRDSSGGNREEMRKAGGGRNILTSYSGRHSSCQHWAALTLVGGPYAATPSISVGFM